MLAERGVNVDHPRFTAGFQRYAPEMEKNGCAGTGPFDLARGNMDETDVKVNGRRAYLYRGRRQPGPHCRFLSPVVTAKLHTGFWVKSSTT